MPSIESQVIDIITEQALLPPGQITVNSTFETLGVDSLGMVETVFAIEERFDIEVPFNANAPDDSGFDMSSVGHIIRAVEQLIAAKNAQQ